MSLAGRNLLGKTDSRIFCIQKKSPQKSKDIGGGWQGMQRNKAAILEEDRSLEEQAWESAAHQQHLVNQAST